ncbi:MAG: PQQ-dependent sugar dehydrogenase [Acidobacteria bacterium]|nr:PQQ-dependent sugar dehydrogenase [Acidobacteriota bacterium]
MRSVSAAIALISTVLVAPVSAIDTVLAIGPGSDAPVAASSDLPPGGTFTDDDENIHEGAIEAIAAVGITKGCNPPANDRFCPGSSVSRGQMAAFLVRALGLTAVSGDNTFTDDNASEFEADIEKLAFAGITKGCNPPTNDKFCPDAVVTRGQMAAFLVRAYGYTAGAGSNRFDDNNNSNFELDIDRLAAAGITLGCNPPENSEYCPNDPVRRDQMATFLTRTEGLTPNVPPPAQALTAVNIGFVSGAVLLLTNPGQDDLFIVSKSGRIEIMQPGGGPTSVFLDITAKVSDGGEKGLLGMAFHPDYTSNGKFYVYYSTTGTHRSRVSEFTVSANSLVANNSEKVIIDVVQPASNHNGGMIQFGPDGYLYIGYGDGGGGGDTYANGQNIDSLLGGMVRIDVDGGDPYAIPSDNPYVGTAGADELWAIGLRNPWRWTFAGDKLIIADVGQETREEINIVDAAQAGVNYGWCRYEGSLSFSTAAKCLGGSNFTFPALEYSTESEGCAVAGGVVGTNPDIPRINGRYFYGDACQGWVKSFQISGNSAINQKDWTTELGLSGGGTWGFGTDNDGNVYILRGGSILMIQVATP